MTVAVLFRVKQFFFNEVYHVSHCVPGVVYINILFTPFNLWFQGPGAWDYIFNRSFDVRLMDLSTS